MKECPICYKENPDSASECSACGNKFDDIMLHYESSDAYTIMCPICGHIYNIPQFNSHIDICEECGCDLSGELPAKKISSELCIYLERKANKKRYAISANNKTTLGRGIPGEINEESFNVDDYSRKECSIEYQNGMWIIYAENSHGHLKINNEDIPFGPRRTLSNGDIITIYKCRFKVVF